MLVPNDTDARFGRYASGKWPSASVEAIRKVAGVMRNVAGVIRKVAEVMRKIIGGMKSVFEVMKRVDGGTKNVYGGMK